MKINSYSNIDKNNRVVKILMQRDDMTADEAISLVEECRTACILEESDEPIQELLELESDYLMDIL